MSPPQTRPALPAFHSIVFPTPEHEAPHRPADLGDLFRDVLLDQVFDAAYGRYAPKQSASRSIDRADDDSACDAEVHAALRALFATPLADAEVVRDRQDVMRDLQRPELARAMQGFRAAMAGLRGHLRRAAHASDAIEGQRWFLDAALVYCDGARALHAALQAAEPQSRVLLALHRHLGALLAAPEQVALQAQATALAEDLAGVRYAVRVDGGTVTVLQPPDEPDYSRIIADVFARFRQGDVRDHRAQFPAASWLNHVEAQILDRVALLYPEVFGRLARFRREHGDFADPRLLRLDRELAFYLGWNDLTQRFVRAGLPVCFPELTAEPADLEAAGMFDMALAQQAVTAQQPVVTNDFALRGDERMMVVTGPNHGGKTTLARTVGQLHHLACLGLPVAARHARLLLCDRIFTHFERVEDIATQRGKLQDDLVRMHRILAAAGPHSIVLMNEVFSSTTLDDALWLARRVMRRLRDIGAVCVLVTFLDELAAFDAHTVSLVAAVDPADPTVRTFKVVRKPADGKSYARALAEKYGVTRRMLSQRIGS